MFSVGTYRWLFRGGLLLHRTRKEMKLESSTELFYDDSDTSQASSSVALNYYCPKISVVVTSYNYAHLIRETLDSLVAQTYKNFEVLVVDNGSQDNSVEIIKEYEEKYPNFFLLQHEGCVNKGLPASVKLGTERATGEFVAFCEADDIWLPEHLQKKVELLRAHWAKPNFIINDIDIFGDEERCRDVAGWIDRRKPYLENVRNQISPTMFREENLICTFSICMVRRSVLLSCDMLSVPRASNIDWWLWRQVCINNDVWCVHEKLTRWRLHKDSYLMRDTEVHHLCGFYDLMSQMDRLLVDKYPLQAEVLRKYLRPEDDFTCKNGKLKFKGMMTDQPKFSILFPLEASEELISRTLSSIVNQSYANWEIVPSSPLGEIAGNIKELFVGYGVEKNICYYSGKIAKSLDEAMNFARGEWVLELIPGDTLREEALQILAARSIVNKSAAAISGKALCVSSGTIIGHSIRTEAGREGRFVCPGAFAVRRDGGGPGMPYIPRPFVEQWVGLIDRFFNSLPLDLCDHILLLHDDSDSGLDYKCRRLNIAADEFIQYHTMATAPSVPPFSDISIIEKSPLFDEKWYLNENKDVDRRGVDPALHYAYNGAVDMARNPSPDFIGEEFLAIDPAVRFAKVNPLCHYERYGARANQPFSFLQTSGITIFPENTVETEIDFGPNTTHKHKRLALFAAYSASGCIPKTTIHYLQGLREVCDNIIFIMNAPVLLDEAEKLRGIVRYAIFQHHGGYDFNSWKIGYEFSKKNGLLNSDVTSELILANDSCYGPIFPFSEAFETMESRPCDFWGLTSYTGFVNVEHVQSFFVVLRRKVLDGVEIEQFMSQARGSGNRWLTIVRCEAGLTARLSSAGYKWDVLSSKDFSNMYGTALIRKPLLSMNKYRVPLVKVKALAGDMDDSREDVVKCIHKYNPKLASLISEMPRRSIKKNASLNILRSKRDNLQESYREIATSISEKVARGSRIKALFFVSSASMFSSKNLFDAMLLDATFDAKIFIIPDMRGYKRNPNPERDRCREELAKIYPGNLFIDGYSDEFGLWPDVIEAFGADVVCYPSPYDISSFRYNPHYAVGRSFLPILINSSIYCSSDKDLISRQNYAYFWKVFFECEATAKEYREYSILKGANADIVGSVKMDSLNTAKSLPRNGNRKRVLILTHCSDWDDPNDISTLSGFMHYASFYLELPSKYPEIDFVFRPHPFLFHKLANHSAWGVAKINYWITRMKSQVNVVWSDESDYVSMFASCDGIIQDGESSLVEWFYTGKPCCYIYDEGEDIQSKLAPIGQACLEHCYKAHNELSIDAFLKEIIIKGNDSKKQARCEFARTLMVNYPNAADAALGSIRKALGI